MQPSRKRRVRTPRIGGILPLALGIALIPAACDDSTGLDANTVRVEGTVEAMFDEGVVPGAGITVDVVGAGGTRAWDVAATDSTGAYGLEVAVPGGCDGDSVDAVLRAEALDHATLVRGGHAERFRLACGATTALDLELYRNVFRSPQPVAGDLVPTQLSVGRTHACVIAGDGAYCWGSARYGRLGNAGVTEDAGSPVAVTNSQSFVQIAAGNDHTCALDDAGAAWCWGLNIEGQVGADTSIWIVEDPYRVQTDLRFSQIQAGRWFSCGLTADGAVYCWGDARGVGTGEPLDTIYTTPQPVILDGTYVAISSIFSSSCALRDTGEAYCWGFSYRGELGGGEDPGHHTTPIPVAGEHVWSTVDAGVVYGCGITTGGAAYCWGTGSWGELGNGGTDDSNVPVPVAGGYAFSAIRAGEDNTCALDGAGMAYCWGSNVSGELGTPAAEDEACTYGRCVTTPVPVPTELRFTALQSGGFNTAGFTCGITTAGELVCWGAREYLGTGKPLRSAAATDLATMEIGR